VIKRKTKQVAEQSRSSLLLPYFFQRIITVKSLKPLALILLLFLFIQPAPPAKADDLLSFGLGWYDFNDNEDAVDFRFEYRFGNPWFWHIKPWLGVEATSDGAVYAASGLLLDLVFDDQWLLTPSFGAGLYGNGSGKDLGNTLQFRSQVEFGYKFEDQSRLGLAVSHISNSSLSKRNPGSEILTLYYHMPVSWVAR